MRQRRWVKLFSDYDCEIRYHPGKANVVADARSSKERVKPSRVRALGMVIQTSLKSQIIDAQEKALFKENLPGETLHDLKVRFETKPDGFHYFKDRVWIPRVNDLRDMVLEESHRSKYSIHPGADKMYKDLKEYYWWPGMKRDIALYVGKCLTCSIVKAEHQKPSSLLQQPEIPQWKWEQISMDFVTKLPRTAKGHDSIWVIVDRLTKSAHFSPFGKTSRRKNWPKSTSTKLFLCMKALGTKIDLSTAYHPQIDGYHTSIQCDLYEALYRRKCRSLLCWTEIGDKQLTRLDLIKETTDKIAIIKDRLKAARDRQKSYADNRRKPLEFQVRDKRRFHKMKKDKLLCNVKAMRMIRFALQYETFCLVGSCTTAKELRDRLKEMYSTDEDLVHLIQTLLLSEFGAFEQKPEEKLIQTFDHFNHLLGKMIKHGIGRKLIEKKVTFMNGLRLQ
ncbi:uncharacterized protein LOC128127916 [Lactuca sativa]|uniref:uncharacterized protein LOC128127916 n=1 Tax=Lactuca sativa TaxID=4236 RepID=UPI0022B06B64|nr:uncharacterized protein LOC128127916 [Lactuca sativa]